MARPRRRVRGKRQGALSGGRRSCRAAEAGGAPGAGPARRAPALAWRVFRARPLALGRCRPCARPRPQPPMRQQCPRHPLAPVAEGRVRACSSSRRLCHSAARAPSPAPPPHPHSVRPRIFLAAEGLFRSHRFSPPPPPLLLLWPNSRRFAEHLPGSLRRPDWPAPHTAAGSSADRHGSARGRLPPPLRKSSPLASARHRQCRGRRLRLGWPCRV